MKKAIKTGLKFLAGALGLILLIVVVFVAFNFTLVKNFPSAQDGGVDAMYIANQKPVQSVSGTNVNDLNLELVAQERFASAEEYWRNTGGKALLIWHKETLIHEQYAEGITVENRSRSFSMHKSILGLVAATMEADGLISLDDPISLYVDAYKKGGKKGLTIRNMLQHESGLERYSFTPPSLDTLNLMLSDKVERTALKAKIVQDDAVFDYSNINYQVAGAAIRTALSQKTSQSYAEYLSSRIWAPAGADEAYLWSETKTGAPRFYAGLQAAPRDWLKIGIMIAQNNGTVIPRSAVDTVLTPSEPNADYGLGVWLGAPKDGQREYGPSTTMTVPSAAPFSLTDTVFFDGFGGQRVYVSQASQLVIVRIGDVRFDWDDTALPNLVVQGLGLGLDLETAYADETLTLSAAGERQVAIRFLSRDPSCSDCKLAILSHGAFAGNADYDAIAKTLADLGYHIAIPMHPDSKSHPLNKSFDPQNYTSYRIEDHNLILDYFAKTHGNSTEWIAVGHSFGAMIAASFAGATEGEAILNSALGPPSKAIVLSPPGVLPALFTQEALVNLTRPTLLVTGTADVVPGMIDNWKDHLALYQLAPKGNVTAVIFNDHDHYFNGLYGRTKERAPTDMDNDLMKVMTNFLNETSLEDGSNYRVMR